MFDKNAAYLLGAYVVFGIGIVGYAVSLVMRVRAARRDEARLEALEAELAEEARAKSGGSKG
ncbi:MAG: hypothetical protein K1X39_00620 [Thermoflexales bacterium]|nr:hypothetical protein [Thermoflexales bacterium]